MSIHAILGAPQAASTAPIAMSVARPPVGAPPPVTDPSQPALAEKSEVGATQPPASTYGTTATTKGYKADLLSLSQALADGNVELAKKIVEMMKHHQHQPVEQSAASQPSSPNAVNGASVPTELVGTLDLTT